MSAQVKQWLRDELSSRLPIRMILKTEPPKLFQDRWADATDWFNWPTVRDVAAY